MAHTHNTGQIGRREFRKLLGAAVIGGMIASAIPKEGLIYEPRRETITVTYTQPPVT